MNTQSKARWQDCQVGHGVYVKESLFSFFSPASGTLRNPGNLRVQFEVLWSTHYPLRYFELQISPSQPGNFKLQRSVEIGNPHFSEKHTNTDSIKVPTNRLGAARPSPLDTMLPTLNHLLPYGNVFARAPTSSIVIHTSLNILSDSVSQNNRTHYFYLGT